MLSRKNFFAVSISTSENYDSWKGIVHKMKFLENLSLSLSQSNLFKYNKQVKTIIFIYFRKNMEQRISYQTLVYGTRYLYSSDWEIEIVINF